MANDKKAKTKRSIHNIIKILAIAIPVLAGFTIACFFILKIIYSINDNATVSCEEGAISIIALAVSVWTGINISNAVEKALVEKIRSEVDSTQSDVATIKQEVSEYKEVIIEIGKLNQAYADMQEYELRTILETSEDTFYRYWGNNYIFSDSRDRQAIFSDNADLLKTNTLLLGMLKGIMHIRELHERGDRESEEYLYSYSQQLIERIDGLEKSDFPDDIVKIIEYTTGDTYFYKAFARYTVGSDDNRYVEVSQLFLKAEKIYSRLRSFFILPETPNIIVRYYDNAIAQCYSELLLCCEKCRDDEESLKIINSMMTLEQVIDEAKYFSRNILKGDSVGDYPLSDERYYKNTGLLYDRIARVYSNDDNEYLKNLSMAINYYEKAAEYGHQEKTYYTLCSAYNNTIRRILCIWAGEDFITLNSKKSIWNEADTSKLGEYSYSSYVDKLCYFSQKAMNLWPEKTIYKCLYELSRLYDGIVVKNRRAEIFNSINTEVTLYSSEGRKKNTMEKIVINVLNNIHNQYNSV